MADVSQQPSAASGAPGAYTKRRRSPTPPPADPYALPDDEPVYVPLKQRRAQLVEKLSAKGGGGVTAAAEKRKHEEETEEREQRERDEAEARRKKREHQTLLMEAQEVKRQRAIDGAYPSLSRGQGRTGALAAKLDGLTLCPAAATTTRCGQVGAAKARRGRGQDPCCAGSDPENPRRCRRDRQGHRLHRGHEDFVRSRPVFPGEVLAGTHTSTVTDGNLPTTS